MMSRGSFASVIRVVALAVISGAAARAAREAEGYWKGAIQLTGRELEIAVELKEDPLSGSIDIPVQGLKGYLLAGFEVKDGSLSFGMPGIPGGPKFAGEFKDHDHLEGVFTQSGKSFPFALHREEKPLPQWPSPPYPYAAEEVKIPGPGGIELAGALTLPKERKGPLTALILLTGSGPQDRDETLFGHKPFLVLADRLTREGYAVLRCDDRGTGKSGGVFAEATEDDFVQDALAQMAWLKARPEIGRIGLAGHSEGAAIAVQAAVQKPDEAAFLVLLAGPGVPMDELLIRQAEDISRASGMPEAVAAGDAESKRRLYPQLKAAKDDAEAEKIVRQLVAEQLSRLSPEQQAAVEGQVETQVKAATSPAFRRILAFDPKPYLLQLKCPVLALNGTKDLQVAARPNLEGVRAALTEGGDMERSACLELPGLNHLFQHAGTGLPTEYGALAEELAPEALDAVVKWLDGLK